MQLIVLLFLSSLFMCQVTLAQIVSPAAPTALSVSADGQVILTTQKQKMYRVVGGNPQEILAGTFIPTSMDNMGVTGQMQALPGGVYLTIPNFFGTGGGGLLKIPYIKQGYWFPGFLNPGQPIMVSSEIIYGLGSYATDFLWPTDTPTNTNTQYIYANLAPYGNFIATTVGQGIFRVDPVTASNASTPFTLVKMASVNSVSTFWVGADGKFRVVHTTPAGTTDVTLYDQKGAGITLASTTTTLKAIDAKGDWVLLQGSSQVARWHVPSNQIYPIQGVTAQYAAMDGNGKVTYTNGNQILTAASQPIVNPIDPVKVGDKVLVTGQNLTPTQGTPSILVNGSQVLGTTEGQNKLSFAASTPGTYKVTVRITFGVSMVDSNVITLVVNPTGPVTITPVIKALTAQYYGTSLTPQSTYAPRSIMTVWGDNLCFAEFPSALGGLLALVKSIGSCQILIDGSTKTAMYYVSKTQANLYIPPDLSLGAHTITVTNDRGGTSVPFGFTAVAAQPNPVVTSSDSLVLTHQNGLLVTPTNPGQPDEVLSVWLTGLGVLAGAIPYDSQPHVAAALAQVQVTLNAMPADVLYAGASGQYPGLDQINVAVPHGAGTVTSATITVIGTDGKSMTESFSVDAPQSQ